MQEQIICGQKAQMRVHDLGIIIPGPMHDQKTTLSLLHSQFQAPGVEQGLRVGQCPKLRSLTACAVISVERGPLCVCRELLQP